MVLQKTLENLRERPKHERTAIAAWIAIAVVAVLFIGWIIYFFNSIKSTPAPDFQSAANDFNASGLPQAQQQLEQAYGSTTEFIQAQGALQLQELGTSSSSE